VRLLVLAVLSVASTANAAPSERSFTLPNTGTIAGGGGLGFSRPGAAFGGRASFGWGSPIGSICLGYRALFGPGTAQHQGELLLLRYLSPESSVSLYGGGGLAIGAIVRDGRSVSGPGLVFAAGIELNRFGSARPAFGIRADFLGASTSDQKTMVGGAFTAEASLTFGDRASAANANYQPPPERVVSDAERAWLARFYARGGADLLTSTDGTAPNAGHAHVGIGSSIFSFEGGVRLANVLRERYLTQLDLQARAYFFPRARHSPFFGLGTMITYADVRRTDAYVYKNSGDPGVLGALGIQFFRRDAVRLDLELRGDAVALQRTDTADEKAPAGFMGVASIGLGLVFGGDNSAARDEKPGPFE